jgi:hypothetical protein
MNRILNSQTKKVAPQNLHTNYLKEQDKLKGDLMRLPPQMNTPLPPMSWRYITLGGLSIVAFGLLVV